jgi:hypothetical protein
MAIIKGEINPDMQAILQSLLMYNFTRKDKYIDDIACCLALHSMKDKPKKIKVGSEEE